MAKIIVALTMSLEGFIAGSNDADKHPAGDYGMRLFDWNFGGDTTARETTTVVNRGLSTNCFRGFLTRVRTMPPAPTSSHQQTGRIGVFAAMCNLELRRKTQMQRRPGHPYYCRLQ